MQKISLWLLHGHSIAACMCASRQIDCPHKIFNQYESLFSLSRQLQWFLLCHCSQDPTGRHSIEAGCECLLERLESTIEMNIRSSDKFHHRSFAHVDSQVLQQLLNVDRCCLSCYLSFRYDGIHQLLHRMICHVTMHSIFSVR